MPAESPPSLRHFRDLQASIRIEMGQRVATHQARIAGLAATPRTRRRPLNLLADGDSWFDYPLPFLQQTDIIAQLAGIIRPAPTILNLAHYGLAITQMMGVSRYQQLVQHLDDPANGRFDAILFSGGGNDVVGEQFRLWLQDAGSVGNDPARALNDAALDAILGVAMAGYRDLVAAREASLQKDVPILVHAYDFAWPTDIAICDGVVGPWLYPSLESRKWMASPADLDRGHAIVRHILERFHDALNSFARANDNVGLVETQGTLVSSQEWANELHPHPHGFWKIAKKFADKLATLPAAKGKAGASKGRGTKPRGATRGTTRRTRRKAAVAA